MDTDTLKANILAALEKNAEAGIRGYSQGDLSVQLEPLPELLKVYQSLAAIPSSGSTRQVVAEVIEP